MALPIKITPILKGENSKRFFKLLKNQKKVSPEEKKRINLLVEKVLANRKNIII